MLMPPLHPLTNCFPSSRRDSEMTVVSVRLVAPWTNTDDCLLSSIPPVTSRRLDKWRRLPSDVHLPWSSDFRACQGASNGANVTIFYHSLHVKPVSDASVREDPSLLPQPISLPRLSMLSVFWLNMYVQPAWTETRSE